MNHTLPALLDQWPLWPVEEPPELIRVFTAGLNHSSALISTSRGKLVIKQFSQSRDTAATSGRNKEVLAQEWASTRGLAPEVLFHSEDQAYCLMEYLGPNSLADSMENTAQQRGFIQDAQIIQLARSLKLLHSVDINEDETTSKLAEQLGQFNIVNWCDVYLPKAGQKAQRLHKVIRPILDAYLAEGSHNCICHNDLVAANCFASNEQALFIDWEYAQLHSPWFDLAALIFYLHLNTSQCQLLMQHYKPEWLSMLESDIFLSSQVALLWGDMLWHLNHFGESAWGDMKHKEQSLSSLSGRLGVTLHIDPDAA